MNKTQRTVRKMRTYTAWAHKNGKTYSTTVSTYSNAAAKRVALEVYPISEGYTDHFGQRRIS